MKLKITIIISLLISLITLCGLAPAKKFKTYKDKEETIFIDLPRNWYYTISDDGKSTQMFISAEELKNKIDSYKAVVSITRIRQMSQSFSQIKNDGDIVKLWYSAIKNASQKHYLTEELKIEKITLGNFKGIITESILQPVEQMAPRRTYQAILAHNDDLYTMTMECSAQEWENYHEIFNRAIASLEIK
ncbi:hypothetical protein BH23BAC1_BH23BAC1_00170 [soil metagenome]